MGCGNSTPASRPYLMMGERGDAMGSTYDMEGAVEVSDMMGIPESKELCCGLTMMCEEEDSSVATHFCSDCKTHLCAPCYQWHSKRKKTADHAVVAVSKQGEAISRGVDRETSQLRSGKQSVSAEHYPMHVMSVSDLLEMEMLEPHETCLAQGLVYPVPPAGRILFASHQWLSYDHPDPFSVQLHALQAMVRTIITDEAVDAVFDSNEWDAFAKGVDTRKNVSQAHAQAIREESRASVMLLTPKIFAQDLKKSFVWFDYFSIPQRRDAGVAEAALTGVGGKSRRASTQNSQLRAIKSIPYYIERATYFVVVAPPTTHRDTKARCDLETWRSRGWCRLEEVANYLALERMNPIVLTEGKVAVQEFADFWSFRANSREGAVGCGNFTCEGDRKVCVEILHSMWMAKLKQYKAENNRMMLTLFGVCQTKILETSQDEPIRVMNQHGETAKWNPEVLEDWRLGALKEIKHPVGANIVAAMLGDACLLREVFIDGKADVAERHAATGATTMMHAAGAGDIESVKFLAEHAAKLGVPLIDAGTTKLNITPIDRAIRCNHTEVVYLLLKFGASVKVKRSSGCSPLHAAAEMGRVKCLQALLDANADIDAVNNSGSTPLHLCSTTFTLFGSQMGKDECMQILVAHGAKQDLRDNRGDTALDVAVRCGELIADSFFFVGALNEESAQPGLCSLAAR